jgi:hypothetical protein
MATKLSRRTLIGALAASSAMLTATRAEESSTVDVRLVDLGRHFDRVTKFIDDAGEGREQQINERLAKFHQIEAEILSTPAKTIEGYRIKARAACWALLGDIDPNTGATTDERMAMSIVRDLIQQYDPELENPGALQELVSHKPRRAVKVGSGCQFRPITDACHT